MSRVVISTDKLQRRFGQKVAVESLTLEVGQGEIFGFLGHNGAGKTTTVRLLNGILGPSAGTVRVLDLDPLADGPALRARTGVLTETPSLDERLTGRENLSIFADLYSVPRDQVDRRVQDLLDAFDLADAGDQKTGGFSKGMKQRLALARAFLHNPELLFLDEPTSGLDPVATRHLHELVLSLSHERQRTVFLCTHNLAEAQQLCDRVAVLEHGRLLAVGTPAELARQYGHALSLEIEVQAGCAAAALDTLRACAGTARLTGEGDIIKVQGAGRERVPEFIQTLVAAQVPIYRVTPQEASLEDVYFALHGEATPAGAMAVELPWLNGQGKEPTA